MFVRNHHHCFPHHWNYPLHIVAIVFLILFDQLDFDVQFLLNNPAILLVMHYLLAKRRKTVHIKIDFHYILIYMHQ